MADFCKQCADDMGFPHSDFIDPNLKPGLYHVSLCEGCGHIQTNGKGECISADCLKPGHNVPLDVDCSFVIKGPIEIFNVNLHKVGGGIHDEEITKDFHVINSLDDINHIKGYNIYVIDGDMFTHYRII